MNSVAVDASGNAYYAGTIIESAYSSNYDLLIAKIAPDGASVIYAYQWYFGDFPINWDGFDAKVDGSGNLHTEGTLSDGSGTPGSYGQLYFEAGPTGDYYIDFGDGGLFGSLDDYGYGIALSSSGHIALVGKTDSTDFPTTGGFQTTYGGGAYDGWIGTASLP